MKKCIWSASNRVTIRNREVITTLSVQLSKVTSEARFLHHDCNIAGFVQFALAMQINIVNHTENPVIKLLARPMQINDVKVIKLLASSMHIASQHLRCIAAKPRPTEICLRILKIDQHLGKIDPHFHFSKIDPHFEIIDPHPKRNESLSGLA